jgi:hypothetical protein
VTQDRLEAAVAAGPSGPVITLTGETDLVSVAKLSALQQLTVSRPRGREGTAA